jgi:lambda family phage minor tail protein L
MNQSIHKEIFEVEPSILITLFEIILKDSAGAKYYFHAGENGYSNTIYYGGGTGANAYHFIPVQANGFDYSDDTLPRPTLTFDNTDGFFSLKTRFFKNFIGYPVRRIRTFAKFLHGKNFPNDINPFGSPTEDSFPIEKYVINQKTTENQQQISFELVSALEKESAFIPNRKIVYNTCQWQYRNSVGCGYSGPPVSDAKGNLIDTSLNLIDRGTFDLETEYDRGDYVKVDNSEDLSQAPKFFVCLKNNTLGVKPDNGKDSWIEDACPKNVNGCRQRFGNSHEANYGLPFGGFPGTWEQ